MGDKPVHTDSRYDDLPLAVAQEIDRVCTAFEDAWKAGGRPAVEDYLGATPPPDRDALLWNLLGIDFHYRRRAGDAPSPNDYVGRLPGYEDLIRAAFDRDTAAAPAAGRGAPLAR